MHIVKRILLVFTLMLSVSLCHAQSSIDDLKAHYFDAAREGNVELLQAFYQAGLDGNVADEKGYTALILAAYHGHNDAVSYLLGKENINACQEDNKGNTALMGAIFKGHLSVARKLMFAQCNIDETNSQGQTALMFASLFDRQSLVNELIEQGANPQHKDLAGNSVADIALSQGNYNLAKTLNESNVNR
ncbi:ankyrin repeat domain-containing protein [uncultured Alteromonas sp.]|jgi:ankyrin repeat protein|uniref:ankyrin repeat domain-containing protein n=1 Tax=uncultured Alteromonas sp. TaxID=179113 RepID=UPI002583E503|nr:ankyrin repeat domain-containing protein [uncultured Alteromonas sp.]|tara:strand:+ start:1388 stop:1954 length:567 start_codon:yes stop_codon:yes gene_type:complete